MASSSRGDEFFTPTSSRLEPSHWAPEGLEILVFYATTTLSRNCENLVPERQDSCSSVGAASSQWSISENLILKIDSFHPQKWKQLKLSTMIKADTYWSCIWVESGVIKIRDKWQTVASLQYIFGGMIWFRHKDKLYIKMLRFLKEIGWYHHHQQFLFKM